MSKCGTTISTCSLLIDVTDLAYRIVLAYFTAFQSAQVGWVIRDPTVKEITLPETCTNPETFWANV